MLLMAVDECYLCCSLFSLRNWKSMLRLGRAALSCSRLWDWHDFQAKKAERKRLQTCEDDVPNQSKATEHDRLNQQNLLKSTNLSLFTCKLSTEKPSSSPKFIGDGKHMNFIDLADLAACTRCATFMLLAHCEGIVVGTIGLYLVPLACFVYFPLELDTELLNGSSINTREVCPSRLQVEPWNAELCFGSSCSKKADVWQTPVVWRKTPWKPEWPRFALACASAGILSTAAWSSRPANQRQWQCHLMTSPLLLWGDVSLRAVSAMAAAVVFDAVARQSTENVPSVLAQANPGVCSREELSRTVEHVNTYNMMEQFPGNRNTFCESWWCSITGCMTQPTHGMQALGQRLGLGQGSFARETAEQADANWGNSVSHGKSFVR